MTQNSADGATGIGFLLPIVSANVIINYNINLIITIPKDYYNLNVCSMFSDSLKTLVTVMAKMRHFDKMR